MKDRTRSRTLVVALVLCLALNVASPLVAQSDDAAPGADSGDASTGEGKITGRVAEIDKAALAGATIIAYHLSSETVFRSEATDGKGNFQLNDLPYGYFDIAVETEEGLFVADQVINVPPSGKASVTMALVMGTTSESPPRGFAGLDQAASGIAQVDTKKSGSFWKSSKGIAILGGVGGAVLLAIALSGGGDDDSSPTNP